MSAIQIKDAAPVAGLEPYALGIDDLNGVLSEDRRQIVHGAHVHPAPEP